MSVFEWLVVIALFVLVVLVWALIRGVQAVCTNLVSIGKQISESNRLLDRVGSYANETNANIQDVRKISIEDFRLRYPVAYDRVIRGTK